MSESTARAERRAIRRAIGPELEAALDERTLAINDLRQRHAVLSQQFASDSSALWSTIHAHGSNLELQQKQIAALQLMLLPLARPWYSRLWWVVTGK